MNNYLAGIQCPKCGATGIPYGTKNGHGLRLCTRCKTLLCWHWETVAEYESQYQGLTYHRDVHIAQGLPPQYERFDEHIVAARSRLDWLEEHGLDPGLSLMDVGASNGALVYEAIGRGFKATGIEVSEDMCLWAYEAHGIELQNGTWKDLSRYYDIITATDVIEHLVDPLGFLHKARSCAMFLYIETPEWRDGLDVNEFKHVRTAEHICLYPLKTLIDLAWMADWEVVEHYSPIEDKIGLLLSYAGPFTPESPRGYSRFR